MIATAKIRRGESAVSVMGMGSLSDGRRVERCDTSSCCPRPKCIECDINRLVIERAVVVDREDQLTMQVADSARHEKKRSRAFSGVSPSGILSAQNHGRSLEAGVVGAVIVIAIMNQVAHCAV